MKTLLLIGWLLMPLTVSIAQDPSLLESTRQLQIMTGKLDVSDQAMKALVIENRNLRRQLEVVAARCP